METKGKTEVGVEEEKEQPKPVVDREQAQSPEKSNKKHY